MSEKLRRPCIRCTGMAAAGVGSLTKKETLCVLSSMMVVVLLELAVVVVVVVAIAVVVCMW